MLLVANLVAYYSIWPRDVMTEEACASRGLDVAVLRLAGATKRHIGMQTEGSQRRPKS
jgi:hypothetical protein